ncbi:MAG: site-specific integrase [Micrococcales bacterium]|nr:site-specific integrase [Micrococcales bacterium]
MSRRARGEGTIYKRKDGRWSVGTYRTDANGARRRVFYTCATQAAARTWLATAQADEQQRIPIPTDRWTVAAWLEHWLKDIMPTRVRPLTIEGYTGVVARYIVPAIGNIRLTELSVSRTQQAVDALVVAGASTRTVQKFRQVLSSALTEAMRQEVVHRNVARLLKVPAWERKPIHPWTPEQVRQFLAVAEGHMWYTAYLFILVYGLRRGEALGLRWCDVDLERSEIHVRQQINWVDGKLQAGPVKTSAGRRTLPLIDAVREALQARAPSRRPAFDPSAEPSVDGTIISGRFGTPIDPHGLLRTFRLLTKRAGLPPITLHQGRHTVATMLKDLGVAPRDAQLILGHAQITTTQQIYQHGTTLTQRNAIQAVSTVVRSSIKKDGDVGRPVQSDVESCTNSGHLGGQAGAERPLLPSLAEFHGETGGARTRDTRLKRRYFDWSVNLPTSDINALHTRAKRLIVAAVVVSRVVKTGVEIRGQLVPQISMRDAMMVERLRRASFPLNLLPRTHSPPLGRQ